MIPGQQETLCWSNAIIGNNNHIATAIPIQPLNYMDIRVVERREDAVDNGLDRRHVDIADDDRGLWALPLTPVSYMGTTTSAAIRTLVPYSNHKRGMTITQFY